MDNAYALQLIKVLREVRDELKRLNLPSSFEIESPKKTASEILQEARRLQETTLDPRDSIIYDPTTQEFHVSVQIQDGYEQCGKYKDRAEAIAAYIQGYKVLNGTRIKPEEVPIYTIEPQVMRGRVEYRRMTDLTDREIALDEMRQDFA